jgi:polyphosphate glucokinase
MKKNILVIDIGGTRVKLMISRRTKRKFDSGPKMTPREMIPDIKKTAEGWNYDVISIGFPAPVKEGKIASEPKHLGKGWVGFDFAKPLGKPVEIINDAAMQALGSYHGGRMLFLGLGTGLGSALVWKGHVLPLELGDLPYVHDGIIEDEIGKEGLERLGKKNWQKEVNKVLKQLKLALIADYIVLGGGNSKLIEELPDGVELGHNRNAYAGGCRLWQTEPGTRRKKWCVI